MSHLICRQWCGQPMDAWAPDPQIGFEVGAERKWVIS